MVPMMAAPLPKNLRALGLDSPEIEAKFDIPDRATLEALKLWVGSTLSLADSQGEPVEFTWTMDKESLYLDTCFDTKHFTLFEGGRMLRARHRHDKGDGIEPEYRFKKAVIQGKTAETSHPGLHPAVLARDEIRSTEKFLSPEAFAVRLPDLLAPGSRDKAVRAVRMDLAEGKKLHPVLEIRDERFLLMLTRKVEAAPAAPSFFVTLDRVLFRGLTGRKEQAEGLYLEAEISGNLSAFSSKKLRNKLALLNSLSEHLASTGLTPAKLSKYERGLRLTVL